MHPFWIALTLARWAACGLLGSHVAGLRGQDKLDGFRTGLLLGPVGVVMLTFKKVKKELPPDVEADCPHCGMRQEVGSDLDWFECWQCEREVQL